MPGKKKSTRNDVTPPLVVSEPPNKIEEERKKAAEARAAAAALKQPVAEEPIRYSAAEKKPWRKDAEAQMAENQAKKLPWEGMTHAQCRAFWAKARAAAKAREGSTPDAKFKRLMLGLARMTHVARRIGNVGLEAALDELMLRFIKFCAKHGASEIPCVIEQNRSAVLSAYHFVPEMGFIEEIEEFWVNKTDWTS